MLHTSSDKDTLRVERQWRRSRTKRAHHKRGKKETSLYTRLEYSKHEKNSPPPHTHSGSNWYTLGLDYRAGWRICFPARCLRRRTTMPGARNIIKRNDVSGVEWKRRRTKFGYTQFVVGDFFFFFFSMLRECVYLRMQRADNVVQGRGEHIHTHSNLYSFI